MKKILLCASVLALAAGCSDNDFESLSTQKQNANGISFQTEVVGDVDTRATLENEGTKHLMRWWAEQDKVSIIGKNTKGLSGWEKKTYKATRSVKSDDPLLAANSSTDILEFAGVPDADQIKAKTFFADFFAVWPASVTIATASSDAFIITMPSLADQDGSSKEALDRLPMYAYTKDVYAKNGYDAVGETVDLSFKRLNSALVFNLSDLGAKPYGEIFGKLKSIQVTTKGYDKDGVKENPTNINYGVDLKYKVDADGKVTVDSNGSIATPNAVEVKDVAGIDWTKNPFVYMAVSSVNRKAFRDKGVKEQLEIVYEFENIKLTIPKSESQADWNPGIVGTPALDLKDFPYLVVTNPTTSKTTLIVNSGKFSDAFKDGKIVWGTGEKELTDFTGIIVNNITLSTAELAMLNDFTNLEEITLNVNTEIPAETFIDLADLTEISMPAVTKIGKDAFKAAFLEKVELPKYDFAANDYSFLKAASLTELDMSAVTSMAAGFAAQGFTLEGFGELTTVTVGDLLVGHRSFAGCTKLKDVKGKVKMNSESIEAFAGSKTNFTEIELADTYISEGAFDGCANLKNILYNGKQVAPSYVGANAFAGCAALVDIDLSGDITIGAGAFNGCTALKGTKSGDIFVLTVGAKTITEEAFAECTALTHVDFTRATKIEDKILFGATNLAQIRFGQKFEASSAAEYDPKTFGNDPTGTSLWVNSEQPYSGNKLLLNAKSEFIFSSISKNAK